MITVRLHKYIADCGIASRRKAEEMISDHLVTVNGRVVTEMGFKINPTKDAVKVRGRLVYMRDTTVYVAFNKPRQVLSTLFDPDKRPTIKDYLKSVKERVFPAGRLDYETEGLVILTNDGEYSQSLIHPTKKITKTYLVKVDGQPTQAQLDRLEMGVTLAEGKVKALSVKRTKVGDQYDWFRIVLVEGKNRQVQRMFAKIGFDVIKLRRIAIGKLTLGGLERGEFKYLTEEEAQKAFIPYDKN